MKLFTMAACALILWLFQGILYHRFGHKGLRADLSFSCAGTVEGERAILKETITNAKALPLPVLHVKFQMGKHLVFVSASNSKITDHNYRSDIFSCMPWQEIRRNLEFTCKKRGYYTISQVQLISYDLFFSNRLVSSVPVDAALYVYPREVPIEKLKLPFRNLCGQLPAFRSLLSDPFETQSVRPYQSYDPYRAINWKATARTGELKVNVYAPTASWQVTFLLDMDSDRIRKDDALTEESLRLCGSYSRLLIQEGIPVSVVTNGLDCLTGRQGYLQAGAGQNHIKSVMELLARIRTGQEGQPTMEKTLETLTKASYGSSAFGRDSIIYILVSPQQRDSMAQAFAALGEKSPGCQWIVPLRPGQEFKFPSLSHIYVFPWEVPYDYSQTS